MTTGSSTIDLGDIVEIQQLLARYGHAIDDRDWTAFRALFLTDAEPHAPCSTPNRA